jgi:hypothetical protein
MGYACPVCDEPQQDAEHLANHLAFQAMTHAGDHESWLDEHAPDWAANGPAELAPRVADLAAEADYDVVFEDTADDGGGEDELYDPDLQGTLGEFDHGNGHEHKHGHGHGQADARGNDRSRPGVDTDELSPETRDVLETAREFTRRMYTGETSDDGEDAEGTDGAPRD